MSNYINGIFRHDPNRPQWIDEREFCFITLAFLIRTSESSTVILNSGYFFLIFIIVLIALAIPLIFIESMLGQFTSTGYFSSLRFVSILKAVGYFLLFLNSIVTIQQTVHFSFYLNIPIAIFGEINLLVVIVFCIWVFLAINVWLGFNWIRLTVQYTFLATFIIATAVFLRFGLIFGTNDNSDIVPVDSNWELWRYASYTAIITISQGIGFITTISSFNKFKANLQRNTILITLGLFVFYLLIAAAARGILADLQDKLIDEDISFSTFFINPYIFLKISAVALIWIIPFIVIFSILQLIRLTIPVYMTVTTLLDEFVNLRKYRNYLPFIICGIYFLASLPFCYTEPEIDEAHLYVLSTVALFIYFVIIISLFWVYGGEKFISDVELMTKKRFHTWKIVFLKYVFPVFLLVLMIQASCVGIIQTFTIRTVSTTDKLGNSTKDEGEPTTEKSLNDAVVAYYISIGIYVLPMLIIIITYLAYKFRAEDGDFRTCLRTNLKSDAWHPAPSSEQHYKNAQKEVELKSKLVEMTSM